MDSVISFCGIYTIEADFTLGPCEVTFSESKVYTINIYSIKCIMKNDL